MTSCHATTPELADLGIVQAARGLRAREYSAVNCWRPAKRESRASTAERPATMGTLLASVPGDFETIFLAEAQFPHRCYADRLELYRASTRATLTSSATKPAAGVGVLPGMDEMSSPGRCS